MKINSATLETCRALCTDWLADRGYTVGAIKTGVDAWATAHRADATRLLYEDRTVTDGHIQTVLEQIFPNAVFKDKKVY